MLDKADILMPRGSAISGRIVDEFGDPVTDAMVSAMRRCGRMAGAAFQSAGRMAMTNDLGQFRLYGLPPGDYYVSAALRDTTAMEISMMGGPTSGPSGPASGYAPTYFPDRRTAATRKITVLSGRTPTTRISRLSRTSRQDHRCGHQLGWQTGLGIDGERRAAQR